MKEKGTSSVMAAVTAIAMMITALILRSENNPVDEPPLNIISLLLPASVANSASSVEPFAPISVAVTLLILYFLSLIIAYMLLVTPGRWSIGIAILFSCWIFPFLSILAVMSEIEKLLLKLLNEPVFLFCSFILAWICLFYIFYKFSEGMFESEASRLGISVAASLMAMGVVHGAILFICQLTFMGMFLAVLAVHTLLALAIIRISLRSRAKLRILK